MSDIILKTLGIAAACYFFVALGLFLIQRQLLYFPNPETPDTTASGLAEMHPVSYHTEDGLRLTSWYAPTLGGRAVIVFFHGNAGNIGDRIDKARVFLKAGYGLLLVGYRGYGGNPGSPTEAGFYHDGRAALGFLAEKGVRPQDVVLYGESLGAGVAVRLAWEQASTNPVAGVILEAPYTSIAETAAHHYPWLPVRWMIRDRFEIFALIDNIATSLLIIHGENDNVIPVELGRRVYSRAREPKRALWIKSGSHNGLYAFGVDQKIIKFIKDTESK